MNLTIIAAVSENNVIGINGRIPWKIKEDMQRFKELTLYHPVIMGRKTYESIPEKFRPLPQRENIILSRTLERKEGIYVARSVDEALAATALGNNQEPYIIGGEQVYNSFLDLSNRIELTRIHKIYYEGDAFFPIINLDEWRLTNKREGSTEDELRYSFLTYNRK